MEVKENNQNFSIDIVIQHPHGIHARPAAKIAKTARNFHSEIILISEYGEVDCKSMLDILSLALGHNDSVRILAAGSDAKEALSALSPLFISTGQDCG